MDPLPYLCFDLPQDEDAAADRFAEKWGFPPERIFEDGRYLKLGPEPERGVRHDSNHDDRSEPGAR